MKRTFSVIVAICILLLWAAPVGASPWQHRHCVCGGNEGANHENCKDVEWVPLRSEQQAMDEGILSKDRVWKTGGYYYLADSFSFSGAVTVPADTRVSLCLNGKVLTGPSGAKRLFHISGNMDICDCAPESQWGAIETVGESTETANLFGGVAYLRNQETVDGKKVPVRSELNIYGGRFVGKGKASSGGLFFLGNEVMEGSSAVMNLYDGVLTGGYVNRIDSQSGAADGGTVGICGGAVFNMYGGLLENGYSSKKGGHIVVYDNSFFNMYGGLIQTGTAEVAGGAIRMGKATVNLEGGTIADCAAVGVTNQQTGAVTGGYGGLIYMDGKGELNLKGTSLRRGNSYSDGGGVYISDSVAGVVNMSAGTVADCVSGKDGGNFRISYLSKFYVTGGTISGGKATVTGGNIISHGTLTMKNCTVSGGEANTRGGNIALYGLGQSTFDSVTVSAGISYSGGNIYVGSVTARTNTVEAVFRDCKIQNGLSTNNAGNIHCHNNAVLTLERTDVTDGVAFYSCGNVFAYKDTTYSGTVGSVTVIDCNIINGISQGTGDNMYANMQVVLSGVVRITSESDGRNPGMYLERGKTVDGSGLKLGSLIDINLSDLEQPFSLTTQGAEYFRGYSARQRVVAKDGGLYLDVPMVAVYEAGEEKGQYTYLQYATKFHLEENRYVKLLGDREENVTLSADTYLDMNGYDLSGSVELAGHSLYGMDSTTNLYDDSRVGILRAKITDNAQPAAPAGDTRSEKERTGSVYRYLAVPESDGWSFHRIYLGIDQVSLHPAYAGLSYRSVFAADATVKEYLDETKGFGVTLSIAGIPDKLEDFSGFGADSFEAGKGNSKLVTLTNILRKGNENNSKWAETVVYGRAFIQTRDGHLVLSQPVAMTLRDVMELLDSQYTDLTPVQKRSLENFYQAYETVFSGWELENIGK